MNKFRVVYETIDGNTKVIEVLGKNAEEVEEKVFCNQADCLQVLSVS